ncbi:MAG: glycerate kinase type-2 family protein [Promethearchaeota archaeon]
MKNTNYFSKIENEFERIKRIDSTERFEYLDQIRRYAIDAFKEGLKAVHPLFMLNEIIKIEKEGQIDINNKIRTQQLSHKYILKIKTKTEQYIYDLSRYNKVLIIGGGKATGAMAKSLAEIIRPFISFYGLINVPYGQEWETIINGNNENSRNEEDIKKNLKKDRERRSKRNISKEKNSTISKKEKIEEGVIVNYAAHPIPDENGVRGTKKMLELAKNADKSVLIIVLISGGGSALMPFPQTPIALKDLQKTNEILLKSGANINEINSIRKHLSGFKGGWLARAIYPKDSIVFIISDVIGDPLDVIASGPTVPDPSTFNDVWNIVEKYNLKDKLPKSVIKHILEGKKGKILETPKKGDKIFENTKNIVIGSAKIAKSAIKSELKKFGGIMFDELKNVNKNILADLLYQNIKLDMMIGEAANYGKKLAQKIVLLNEFIKDNHSDIKLWIKNQMSIKSSDIDRKIFFFDVTSGEFTVTIKGNGIGGRNQEMLLSTLYYLVEYISQNKIDIKNFVNSLHFEFFIMSIACDGIEGNSPAAGAFIDSNTLLLLQNNSNGCKSLMKNNNTTSEILNCIKLYLDNNDSYNFFKKLGHSIEIGQTGTNINDICLIIIKIKTKK